MNRKIIAVSLLALSVAVNVAARSQGRMGHHSLIGWIFYTVEGAVFFPGGLLAVILERCSSIELGRVGVIVASLAFWAFPVARVRRWFGTFDAFKQGRRHPLFMKGAAALLDTLNRLRLGRGRTGGWA